MNALVRTFRAPDARAALAMVKAAMGPDAVILATQEVKSGLFKKPEVEVTAALQPPKVAATPAPAPTPPAPPSAPPPVRYNAARPSSPLASRPSAPQPPPSTEVVADELIALRSAVESMRQEFTTRASAPTHAPRFDATTMSLYTHLTDRGVDAQIAQELIQLAAGAHGTSAAGLWQGVRSLVAERLVPTRAPWAKGHRRVMALVGPTGVGKTTTLAKIAARALVESKISVALITVDTYRIGAADQVARYGHIMNVPARVAHNAKELQRALELSANAELVLIDTAGRSKAEELVAQAQLLRSVGDVQLALCLSAAAGSKQLEMTAKQYAALRPERLVFTKLDESAEPASILAAAAVVQRPVACVCDGQRVPEDVHAPSAQQLLDIALGRWASAV